MTQQEAADHASRLYFGAVLEFDLCSLRNGRVIVSAVAKRVYATWMRWKGAEKSGKRNGLVLFPFLFGVARAVRLSVRPCVRVYSRYFLASVYRTVFRWGGDFVSVHRSSFGRWPCWARTTAERRPDFPRGPAFGGVRSQQLCFASCGLVVYPLWS